jgi:hypothetical protein
VYDRSDLKGEMTQWETHLSIERTLYRYCNAVDSADFAAFAEIFTHGQWFMVDEPGAAPVLEWFKRHTILYDGQTKTKHQITNLIVDEAADGQSASFTCTISIWQGLDDFPIQPIVMGRFAGTFVQLEGEWWWKTHRLIRELVGDRSRHIRELGTVGSERVMGSDA